LGTPLIRTPLRNAAKWRFLALFGAFWEGFVADLDSQKQLATIAQAHLYHRRKCGKSGRGTQGCDLPNRDGIDDRPTGAVRGALAPFKTLAERPGAAVVLMSHATSGVFKAGNTAGFSKNQLTRARCRINAAATSEGFGAVRKMELATWRPRNHPLIAFKDGKGSKDCRAAARAIFAKFPRSMCAGPIHREDSRFEVRAFFWEITSFGNVWELFQSTVEQSQLHGGRESV
jgi:hypothetical protein